MEKQILTDEQKDKIKKLRLSSMIRGALLGLKTFLLLGIASAFIIFIDFKYVQSQNFLLLAGFLNGFLLFRISMLDFKNEHNRIKTELEKILNS